MKSHCIDAIAACLLAILMAGCGGAGGSGSSPVNPPPPSPGFTLSVSPAAITVAQGGSGQVVQVIATAQNGFTGAISVNTSALPQGVQLSPATLSLTPGIPADLVFSASSGAPAGQQTISVEGGSGALAAQTPLQLTVQGVAVPDPYLTMGGELADGFYDKSRHLLFATNLSLNELDVISTVDFSVKARVPVPQPFGIDQMPDGKTLVIGTMAQEIVTVDEDTYSVTLHPLSENYAPSILFYPTVAAMANGKVLILTVRPGHAPGMVYYPQLYEWDSATGTLSPMRMPPGNALQQRAINSIARSADHKWAVFSSNKFNLYSSDTDSLTSISTMVADPPGDTYGIRGYAINADGTKIAVVSAAQVTFLNRSLAVLGSTPILYAFQSVGNTVQFSQDGQRILLQYSFPLVLEEVDANTYSDLGYISGEVNPDANGETLLTTDDEGHAYVGDLDGLLIMNLMQPPVPIPPGSESVGVPLCPSLNAVLPLNSARQFTVALPPGLKVYVGGQPAPLSNGGTSLTVPASSISGPADIECVGSDGNITMIPYGVSYGVQPLALSANLVPPAGNPLAYLSGYGFSASRGEIPSVTVNGRADPNVGAPLSADPPQVMQNVTIQIPNGAPGKPVAVSVSSSAGTGALSSVATYYASPTILPATGLLQLTYDAHRNVLYALKAEEVDVLDATTLTWRSPIELPPAAKGITCTAMALSPDGATLAVFGASGTSSHLILIDPGDPSSASVATYTGSSLLSGSITITATNKVVLGGSPAAGFDLATSTFFPISANAAVVRTSADGTHLYGSASSASPGNVFSIDPSSFHVVSSSFLEGATWTDLAVSPDGNHFATVYDVADAVGFFDSGLHYINANVYPALGQPDEAGVLGAAYGPGGQVLMVPVGDSIEFWDATAGTLRARLLTPEALPVMVYPEGAVAPMVAFDAAGKTIYAISATGLTVITLPEPMDQLPATHWPNWRLYRSLSSDFRGMPAARRMAFRDSGEK